MNKILILTSSGPMRAQALQRDAVNFWESGAISIAGPRKDKPEVQIERVESKGLNDAIERGIRRPDVSCVFLFGTDVRRLDEMPSNPRLWIQHPGRFDSHRVTNNLPEAIGWYNAWSDFP